MALVARAHGALAGGDPRALKRLSVQFRGMGFPEPELVVTGTVKRSGNGTGAIETGAPPGENQGTRNAEAETRSECRPRAPSTSSRRERLLESLEVMLSERQQAILG